jgi:hypothetical protein
MMQRLGQILLEDQCLKTAAHNIRSLDTQHIIELTLVLIEKTKACAAAEKSLSLEDSLRVFLIEGEQISGGFTHLGQNHLNAPNLTLVLQAELADNLHLIIETLLLERTTRSLRSLGICDKLPSQNRKR